MSTNIPSRQANSPAHAISSGKCKLQNGCAANYKVKYKNAPIKKYNPKELEEIEYQLMNSRNGMHYVNEYKRWNDY